MNFISLLDKSRILLRVSVDSLPMLYEQLVESILDSPFGAANPGLDRAGLVSALLERDARGGTALGQGFAYPHARIPQCSGAALALATLDPPLAVEEAADGQRVDTVFLLVGPEKAPNLFLKVMSGVAQFAVLDASRKALMEATDVATAYRILERSQLSTDMPVRARDIMRPLCCRVDADKLLKAVSHAMLESHVESVPVLCEDGRVLGEITSDALFQYGLPDFFSQLRSVSFIREFDPVEKYFEEEGTLRAKEVMSTDFASVPPEGTLMEIVFLLAVRRYAKVYVLDDCGFCLGVIDRMLVLDRVINI